MRRNISIESPCNEKWNNMKPASNGRFCDACSKPVTDFTKMSSKEMEEYFHSDANACGRFKPSQLSHRGQYPSLQKAMLIVISSLLFLTSCGLFKPRQLKGAYSLKPGKSKIANGNRTVKS